MTTDQDTASKAPRILTFGIFRIRDIRAKGNIGYLRHYETWFDDVIHASVVGNDAQEELVMGQTRLVSIGGQSKWLDGLLAPFRLYRFARANQPTVILTTDIVFGAWTSLLLRHLMGARLVLMPICIPHQLHEDNQKSLSRLPIPWERRLIRSVFRAAHTVVVPESFGAIETWLRSDPNIKEKLLVVPTMPDALPSPEFLSHARAVTPQPNENRPFRLTYVGRLHHEKLVEDTIEMAALLKKRGLTAKDIQIEMIGDGPQRETLANLAQNLGVTDMITFSGAVPNEDLPQRLARCHAFLSPLTGSALREAGLCGLPVIAYDRDWLKGLLIHNETALLTPSRDIQGLADQTQRLMSDPTLNHRLSTNLRRFAWQHWGTDALPQSLRMLTEHVARD